MSDFPIEDNICVIFYDIDSKCMMKLFNIINIILKLNNDIILYYIIIYHIISYYIILYYIISYYIILYHIISYYITLYHIISHYITLYHIISYYIILLKGYALCRRPLDTGGSCLPLCRKHEMNPKETRNGPKQTICMCVWHCAHASSMDPCRMTRTTMCSDTFSWLKK